MMDQWGVMICPEETGNAGEGLQISHTVIVRDWSIRVNVYEKVLEVENPQISVGLIAI